MKYEHRPTPVDAVQWTGDLVAIREFLAQGEEMHVDAGVLWVTSRQRRTLVFPVAPRHYLVRLPSGELTGLSTGAFEQDYQPKGELVGA